MRVLGESLPDLKRWYVCVRVRVHAEGPLWRRGLQLVYGLF